MREDGGTRIIGLGNAYRRDDGVGIWVARHIDAASWPEVMVRALDASDTVSLLSAWGGARAAYLIDAVQAEAAPGTIVRLGVQNLASPDRPRFLSSHGLGLEEAIALGRALGMLPKRLIIYGIVGRDFAPGQGLSPAVEHGAKEVIRRLSRIARPGEPTPCTNSLS